MGKPQIDIHTLVEASSSSVLSQLVTSLDAALREAWSERYRLQTEVTALRQDLWERSLYAQKVTSERDAAAKEAQLLFDLLVEAEKR